MSASEEGGAWAPSFDPRGLQESVTGFLGRTADYILDKKGLWSGAHGEQPHRGEEAPASSTRSSRRPPDPGAGAQQPAPPPPPEPQPRRARAPRTIRPPRPPAMAVFVPPPAPKTSVLRLLSGKIVAGGEDDEYPGDTIRALLGAYDPLVSVEGLCAEGSLLTARITYPELPVGHPPVGLRVRTVWLRQRAHRDAHPVSVESVTEAMRSRGRGVYAIIAGDSRVKPGGDSTAVVEDVDEWELIDAATNRLQYEPARGDIGRRLRFEMQPLCRFGQAAITKSFTLPEVLCPPPHVRGFRLTTRQGVGVLTGHLQASALDKPFRAEGREHRHPCPGVGLVAKYEYIGGEAGEHRFRWWSIRDGDAVKLESGADVYMVREADVGAQIRVEMVPVRADGSEGVAVGAFTKPVSTVCPYSQDDHLHMNGVCPYEIHWYDIAALRKKRGEAEDKTAK